MVDETAARSPSGELRVSPALAASLPSSPERTIPAPEPAAQAKARVAPTIDRLLSCPPSLAAAPLIPQCRHGYKPGA
jgi:hypothetical protein